ncbi:protein kinase domain-containing protein [Purpureocillium lavendulum]|uniref:Protein kinase domain-containing protein n=1 Tax=Purpureocillium lavendulum TaxID=1247861 RepID=A0AB34FLS4_9HYPO|nr:protein kinase domain-containing protein [Purpureocillium lavendulum]
MILTHDTIDADAKKLADHRRADPLPAILDKYAKLIESYKHMKDEYEEERRERRALMASGQGRGNPFALVVVDGDAYNFQEGLVLEREDGGAAAAKQLSNAVKNSLRRKGLESCDIIVRVYANLVDLSRRHSKQGICGHEKRALAPFAAGFTGSGDLMEHIDTGEQEDGTRSKVKAALRLYANNAQCKHIYFAACHDEGHIAELLSYTEIANRCTLIRTPSLPFHERFLKLNMNIEEPAGIFRTSALNSSSNAWSTLQQPPHPTRAVSPAPSSTNDRLVCPHYTKGKCKFGSSCKNAHVDPGSSGSQPVFNGNSGSKDNISSLPKNIPEGIIALNGNDSRLDAAIDRPTPEALKMLNTYTSSSSVCVSKQISGYCNSGDRCKHDHAPMPADLKPALEWKSRSAPCRKSRSCRMIGCVAGHVCQTVDCGNRGGKRFCKFPADICQGDYQVRSFANGEQ